MYNIFLRVFNIHKVYIKKKNEIEFNDKLML